MLPRIAAVLLAAMLVLPMGATALHRQSAVEQALDWLRAQQENDGSIGGAAGSDWATLAFRAAGVDPASVRRGPAQPSLVDFLKASTASLPDRATSWERRLLAAVAAEGPAAARDFSGVNLLARVLGYFDGTQFGDNVTQAWALNDDYFALLALHAAGVPSDSPVVQATREWVFLHQQPNGGWSWGVATPNNPSFAFTLGADVDDTAAAIQALWFTVGSDPLDGARTNVAIDRGLVFIRSHQFLDGGCFGSVYDVAFSVAFGGVSGNTDSTSWAITALNALGEDPEGLMWTQPTGKSLVSFLLDVQLEDGSFPWKPGSPSFEPTSSTAWAALALAGGSFLVVP